MITEGNNKFLTNRIRIRPWNWKLVQNTELLVVYQSRLFPLWMQK